MIKWAGKNRNKRWVRALMWPGLMLQNLTTREPDHDQLAVAIRSLEEVLANEDPEQAKKEAADRDRRLASQPSRRARTAGPMVRAKLVKQIEAAHAELEQAGCPTPR